MYEELRDMKGKEPTPEIVKRKEELNTASQELYGEANKRIASRTPRFAHLPIEKSVGGMGRFRIGMSVHHVAGTNKAKGTHSMSKHQNKNTTQQALQPGYFDWNGIPAHRDKYAATPKFFTGTDWKHVDEGKFAHEARRIPEHEFEEMVALRKHQHEKHAAGSGK